MERFCNPLGNTHREFESHRQHQNIEDLMQVEITDYNYIASAIGNGLFSGLLADQIWSCIYQSKNPQELDAAISATISLKELQQRASAA